MTEKNAVNPEIDGEVDEVLLRQLLAVQACLNEFRYMSTVDNSSEYHVVGFITGLLGKAIDRVCPDE